MKSNQLIRFVFSTTLVVMIVSGCGKQQENEKVHEAVSEHATLDVDTAATINPSIPLRIILTPLTQQANLMGASTSSLTMNDRVQVVNNDDAGAAFTVLARIENTTSVTHHLQDFSCIYSSGWRSNIEIWDGYGVRPRRSPFGGWNCLSNILFTIDIGPNESYEKTLFLFARYSGSTPAKIPFRVGFKSVGSTITLWSNEAVVEVIPK